MAHRTRADLVLAVLRFVGAGGAPRPGWVRRASAVVGWRSAFAAAWALVPGLALLAGCGAGQAPRELASEFSPDAVESAAGPASMAGHTRRVIDDSGEWLVMTLGAPASYPVVPSDWPGVARAIVPPVAALLAHRAPNERAPRLVNDAGREWRYLTWWNVELHDDEPLGLDRFTARGGEVYVPGDPDTLGTMTLHVPLRRAQHVNGRSRVALGPLLADGFDLWPGERWSVQLTGDVATQLDFLFAAYAHGGVGEQPSRWTLEFEGRPLATGEVLPRTGELVWDPVTIDLGRRRGRLTFSVEGGRVQCAFVAPRLRARSSGAASPRPDAAIFLADTFRADLLGHETAAGSLTPNLDAFAATAVRFTHARSPSSWTLPAHGSLFTTLQPVSHGALARTDRMPDGPVYLAQRLRALGYRTVAVTNGGFVSRSFGMERGFEIFYEARGDNDVESLIDELERLLGHQDERPLFLFFHTYRTHEPYVVADRTRDVYGEALGLGAEWHETMMSMVQAGYRTGEPAPDGLARQAADLRALYLGGAADLDLGFGRWLDVLAAAGRDDVVFFTSDHGEAFGERDGRFGHALDPYEDQLRVPLVVRAPGLRPAVVEGPATLMDVARTMFALLDLPPAPGWEGRALLGAAGRARRVDAPVALLAEPERVAWIEGRRKVVGAGAALERREVFDLSEDPWERVAAAPSERAWADARLDALLEDADWRRPRFARGRAVVSSDQAAQLEALGYTGDDT